jgi:glutathione S-transferase
MILYDADVPSPNAIVPRLFAHERGGLQFEAQTVALSTLENRSSPYVTEVNPRGEVPALRFNDGRVLTEVTAICEYFDEVAVGGRSMIGETAEERALTRMWTRRVDLEIAEPVVAWWRGGDDAEAFYRGNRILSPAGRRDNRLIADRGLNQLDDDLAGRDFICCNRPMLADILLFGFLLTMQHVAPWANVPGRKSVSAWFERMSARESMEKAMVSFDGAVTL